MTSDIPTLPHSANHHKWSEDRRPHPLTVQEWGEVMALPEIRESWGLDDDATLENFSAQVYAAKFDFVSGSPGYVGDLFIVQGDVLTGDPPFVIVRKEGKLVLL